MPTSLLDDTARTKEDARRIAAVRRFGRERGEDELAQVLLPFFGMVLTDFIFVADDAGPARSAVSIGRNLVRARSRSKGPGIRLVGPVLAASTSRQNLRVLDPIVAELEQRRGPAVVPAWTPLSGITLAKARRRAATLTQEARRFFSAVGAPLPSGVGDEILRTAIVIERTRWLLRNTGARVLVVASQHNSASRAMLHAAHDVGGITTVYVPHAPVADVFYYRDLPCHKALLRGPAEVAFYAGLGVDEGRLSIAGDPSLSHWPPVAAPTRDDVVFAVSAHRAERVEAAVAVVRDAGIERVEVAPHPRMDRDALRAQCPSSWVFNPAPSTFGRLAEVGAAAVIQDSSGLGLEALALGLPVIDLCPVGSAPLYPFITAPHVDVVSSSDTLATAVADAVASRSTVTSEERANFAAEWSEVGGSEAAALAADAIEGAVGLSSGPVLLDGWNHS